MAALPIQTVVDAGTKPSFGPASASDTAQYGTGHNTFVIYRNADTNAKTVTAVVPGNNDYGQPNPDPTWTLAANNGEAWIPLHQSEDDGNGTGTVTLTVTGTGGATGVTAAAVRVAH